MKYYTDIEEKVKKAYYKPFYIYNTVWDEEKEKYDLGKRFIEDHHHYRFFKDMLINLDLIQSKQNLTLNVKKEKSILKRRPSIK